VATDATLLALGVDSSEVTKGTAALSGLEKQSKKTEDAADSLAKRYGAAGFAVGAALGATAIAIAKMTFDAIAAADALSDLAGGTGRAIEELQALSVIADKSGSSLQGILTTLNVVSKGLTKNADETGKYANALAFFGVASKDAAGNLRSAEAVAYDVAKAYSEAEKTASTSAAAQIALGGSYEKQIPALLALKEKQAELNKLREYGALVDDNLAAAADRYNDTLRDVKSVVSGIGNDMARTFLPILQAVADWFIRSATNGGILAGSFGILKGAFEAVAFAAKVAVGVLITLDSALQVAGRAIGAFFAIVSRPLSAGKIWDELKADIRSINDTTNKALEDLFKTVEKTGATAAVAGKKLGDFAAVGARAGKTVKDAFADYASAIAQLELATGNQEKALVGVISETMNYDKALLQIEQDLIAGKRVTNEQIDAYLDAAQALDEVTRKTKEYAQVQKEAGAYASALAKEHEDWEKQVAKVAESVDTLVEKLQAETRAIQSNSSMTNEQSQALRKLDDDLKNGLIPTMAEYEARVRAVNDAFADRDSAQAWVDSQKAAIAQQKKDYEDLYNYIDDVGRQAFAALTDSGGNAAKKITEVFKTQLLAFLYKLAVQPFIVNIAASISGSGGAGGPLSLLTGGGIGDIFGGLGNIFSNAGSTVSNFVADLDHGVGVIDAFSTAISTGGASLLSVLGIVGTVASIAYSLFGNKGGGPKGGGFAGVGDFSGISGTDSSGRYFTPNTSDSDLTKMVDAISRGYTDAMKALGLTGGNVGFALGFDTDPKGTASNNVHSGAFLNGQQIFNNERPDIGRDDTVLQETILLEGKRIMFAAIQASLGDAPAYIAQLFEGIDAATISSEQIDTILATAQALKTIVDVMGMMGDQFASLDPEQMQAFVESMGGLQSFLAGAAFLNENFTTDADKAAKATEQLNDAFAALGVQVPSSHQAFLDLLGGLDLTTEAGRTMYASLVNLAPAFVRVNGTAQDATTATDGLTDAERELTAARKEAISAANDFFDANFYSDLEQAGTRIDAAWQLVHQAWNENAQVLLELGYNAIPTTNEAFRAMIESLRAVGSEDLANSLILLAPAIFGLNADIVTLGESAGDAANGISTAVDTINAALSRAQEQAGIVATGLAAINQAIDALVNGSSGDFGEKLALRLRLNFEQLSRLDDLIAAEQGGPNPYGPVIAEYQKTRFLLATQLGFVAADLARFTVLRAQYNAEIAGQLVELEKWFVQMQATLARSPEALAALQIQFDEKWKAIIDGTSTGVDGALSEFERLQEGIKEFLAGLLLGDLSTLTPAEKLAEAKNQYETNLSLAQGGDLAALGGLTADAEAYLTIARDFYASGEAYTAIFSTVAAALTAISVMEQPTGEQPSTNAALVSALPTSGRLLSNEEFTAGIDTLAVKVAEVLLAMADSSAVDAAAARAVTERTSTAVAEAVSARTK